MSTATLAAEAPTARAGVDPASAVARTRPRTSVAETIGQTL